MSAPEIAAWVQAIVLIGLCLLAGACLSEALRSFSSWRGMIARNRRKP